MIREANQLARIESRASSPDYRYKQARLVRDFTFVQELMGAPAMPVSMKLGLMRAYSLLLERASSALPARLVHLERIQSFEPPEEGERLRSVRKLFDSGEPISPIVVLSKDFSNGIIPLGSGSLSLADGGLRVTVARERGRDNLLAVGMKDLWAEKGMRS